MKKECLVKTLALGVIVLFISVSYQPIIAEETISVEKESNYDNCSFEEAKEYLFQTIIDISNNPEVKDLLKQSNQRLFTSDYDYKDVFLHLLFRKPRLLKSLLFTRPKMTIEYLDKSYNNGAELINLLEEEESLDMVESVKITEPEMFNELKNIILNDEELSNQIFVLEEMNNDLKFNFERTDFPIICGILELCFISSLLGYDLFGVISEWAYKHNFYLLSGISNHLCTFSFFLFIFTFFFTFYFLCPWLFY